MIITFSSFGQEIDIYIYIHTHIYFPRIKRDSNPNFYLGKYFFEKCNIYDIFSINFRFFFFFVVVDRTYQILDGKLLLILT